MLYGEQHWPKLLLLRRWWYTFTALWETPSSSTNSCNECLWHCSQKIQWNKTLNDEWINGRFGLIKLKKKKEQKTHKNVVVYEREDGSTFWYRFSLIYNTALVPANQVISRTKGGKNKIISLKAKFENYIFFYNPTTKTSIPWSAVVQLPNNTKLPMLLKKTKNRKGKGKRGEKNLSENLLLA